MPLACSSAPVSREDVVGSYSLSTGSARDEIEVFADGRYTHTYDPHIGAAAVDSGTWSLGEYDGMRVLFENFRSWSRGIRYSYDANAEQPRGALWPALIQRSFSGDLLLVVDSDLDLKYVKRK
jgi:hypothetical protein